MDIRTAAHYMQLGYRIRRECWDSAWRVSVKSLQNYRYSFTVSDLLADDWEVDTRNIVKDFPLTYSDEE